MAPAAHPDPDAVGAGLSREQLRFLARARGGAPGARLAWHRRGDGVLVELRARAATGRERSLLVAGLEPDGTVRLDVPLPLAA